jgi:hypothetical protein
MNYTIVYKTNMFGESRNISINVNRNNDDRAREMVEIWNELNQDEPIVKVTNNTTKEVVYSADKSKSKNG